MQKKELINIITESINKQINILYEKIEVNNHIKDIITEEYGISFDIEKLTLGICGLIKKEAKTIEKKYDSLNVPHKYGVVQTKAFDQPLTIDFDIIMFKDNEAFNTLASQYNYTNSFNWDNKIIYLTIIMINGQYVMHLLTEAIQHELSHIYDFFSYRDNLLGGDDELP